MGTTADKLEYLDGTKSAIKQAIVGKGVAVPDGTTFRAYAEKIGSIIKVPALSNPGSAGDLRSGKQLAGADGSVITGTLTEVEQATPTISVSSGGLITASATQSGGIVEGGSKSATKQLTTQGAKTVTPGKTAQTAVASGRYTTGAVTVKGDADLKSENIAEGINIFGVTGTHSGLKEISGSIGNVGPYYALWRYVTKTGQIETDDRSLPGIVAPTLLISTITSAATFAMTGGIERVDVGLESAVALFYVTDDFTLSVTS